MILEYIGAGVLLVIFGAFTWGGILLELDKDKEWRARKDAKRK